MSRVVEIYNRANEAAGMSDYGRKLQLVIPQDPTQSHGRLGNTV